MNILLSTLLLATTVAAIAAPPKVYPSSRYSSLVRNSPFTDKPDPPIEEPEVNDLPDWTLAGISGRVDGFEVTIMNTKDRSLRLKIPSKEAAEQGFKLVKVNQQRNYKQSTVTLQKGGTIAEVAYDEKFLTLKTVAAPPAAQRGNNRGNNNRGNAQPNNRNNNNRANNRNGSAQPRANNRNNQNNNGAPPTPGATQNNRNQRSSVPTPNATPSANTNSNGGRSSTQRKRRLRYVPRPPKK